jgi:hypothetical protein
MIEFTYIHININLHEEIVLLKYSFIVAGMKAHIERSAMISAASSSLDAACGIETLRPGLSSFRFASWRLNLNN